MYGYQEWSEKSNDKQSHTCARRTSMARAVFTIVGTLNMGHPVSVSSTFEVDVPCFFAPTRVAEWMKSINNGRRRGEDHDDDDGDWVDFVVSPMKGRLHHHHQCDED